MPRRQRQEIIGQIPDRGLTKEPACALLKRFRHVDSMNHLRDRPEAFLKSSSLAKY